MSIKNYENYCRNFEGKAEKTIVSYLSDIHQFEKFIAKDLKEATTGDVISWISGMDVAGSTKKRKVRALSSYFKYLINIEGLDMKNPIININTGSIKQEQLLPKYLSKSDIKKFMKSITNARDSLIMDLLFNTGIRISELTSLNIEDIKDSNSMIVYGKGGKERKIFFNERLKKSIATYIDSRSDECEALFVNRYNERFVERGIQKMFSKYIIKSGLEQKEFTVHSTRHTFATQMLNSGVPITTVSQMLGHADLKTTQIYAKVLETELESAGKGFDVFG